MDFRYLAASLVRLFPSRLRQSADNPLQPDRLPPTVDNVELDYPVAQHTPAAASAAARAYLFAAAVAPGVLSLIGFWTPLAFFNASISLLALAIAAALAAYWLLAPRLPALAPAAAATAGPATLLAASRIAYPQLLALAIIVAVQVALCDRLVTNYLYLKTAAPMDRARGQQIRARWGRRRQPTRAPLPGTELWIVSQVLFALLFAAPILLLALEPIGMYRTAAVYLIALMALFTGALVRNLAARSLFGRSLPPLRRQLPAVKQAIVEWLTYNSHGILAPGVHSNPAGSCRARRGLSFALILAFATLWVACAVRPTSPIEMLYHSLRMGVAVSERTSPPQPSPNLTPAEQKFAGDRSEEYLALKRRLAEESSGNANRSDTPPALASGFWSACLLLIFMSVVEVVVPALMSLSVAAVWLVAATGPTLAGVDQLCGAAPRRRVLSTDHWDMLVNRLRSSQDKVEQESLFLGTNARDDSPVLVPRSVFQEHAHLLGDSGSGKTALGILPLVTQLVRFGDASVIVIDLKADDQLFLETLRDEAQRVGEQKGISYPFRWFTTVLGRSSFVFNPLTQPFMGTLSSAQQTDVLISALGLQYGEDYGRKFYSDANYHMLASALAICPHPQSFGELELALLNVDQRGLLPRKTIEAATHVRSSIRRLAGWLPLNACEKIRTPRATLDAAIDLADLFRQPQALYVALPTAAGVSSTAEIARLFIYLLMSAAQAHPASEKRVQVYLVIDEFQRIVAHNVELFLQQARSMNIGCILSNQSLADLDRIGAELVPAMRTNTRFRQIFGAGHRDDINDLIETSGETVHAYRTWKMEPSLLGAALNELTLTEQRHSRLSINDILMATDALGRNIACVRRGEGYAQYGGLPFVMDSVFHIPKHEYERRQRMPWPAGDERTIVSRLDSPLTPPPPTILDDLHPPAPPPPAKSADPAVILDDSSPSDASPRTEPALASADDENDLIDDIYQQQRDHDEKWRRRAKRRKGSS